MSTYLSLLQEAEESPQTADFSALREAYATEADPPDTLWREQMLGDISAAAEQEDWEQVIALCEELLEEAPLDIQGHFWAKDAYERVGRHDTAWHHYSFANALVEAIRASGDGQHPQSAYALVDHNDLWAFLEAQGQQYLSETDIDDGHIHVLRVRAQDSYGGSRDIYFRFLHEEAPPASAASAPTSRRSAPPSNPSESTPSNKKKRRKRPEIRYQEDEEPQGIQFERDPERVLLDLGIQLQNGSVQARYKDLTQDAKRYFDDLQKQQDPRKIKKGAGWFLSLLGLLSGIGLLGLWASYIEEGSLRRSSDYLIFTLGLVFSGAICLVWGGARFWSILRSPLGSYSYPAPFFFVQTNFDHVEAWPYLMLDPSQCMLTHHTSDGNYSYSDLSLFFTRYGAISITIHGQMEAEEFLASVFERRADAFHDLVQSDYRRAEGVDLLATTQPSTGMSKRAWWFRPLLWTGVTVLCFAVGKPINAYYVEEAAWSNALEFNRDHSYRWYLRDYPNGRYRNEANEKLDEIAYEDARKAYKMSAFRKYLLEYPSGRFTSLVKQMVSEVYDKAIASYKNKIGSSPSAEASAMLSILEDLKKHDTSVIYVRFTPTIQLEDESTPEFQARLNLGLLLDVSKADAAVLQRQSAYIPPPLHAAFVPEQNRLRESVILKRLQDAFDRLFTQNVIEFTHLTGDAPANTRTVFHIRYTIQRRFLEATLLQRYLPTLQRSDDPVVKARAALMQAAINDPKTKGIPMIYTQTRTTSPSYRYGRPYKYGTKTRTPVRTLYGIAALWGMEIERKGEKPLKLDITSAAADHVRLSGGYNDPTSAYRQMAESAFQNFASLLTQRFGITYGSSFGRPRYTPPSRQYGLPLGTQPLAPFQKTAKPPVLPSYKIPSNTNVEAETLFSQLPPAYQRHFQKFSGFMRTSKLRIFQIRLDSQFYRLPYRTRQRYQRLPIIKRRDLMLHANLRKYPNPKNNPLLR